MLVDRQMAQPCSVHGLVSANIIALYTPGNRCADYRHTYAQPVGLQYIHVVYRTIGYDRRI